jgi:hypothetical protein
MTILQRYWLGPLLFGGFVLAAPPTARAQIFIPPNNGFNATIVLPSTIDAFYTGLNEGLEKAGDGIDSMNRGRGRVREGTGSLKSLRPGTPVAVQYSVKGIQASADGTSQIGQPGSNVNEGVVTKVDRDDRKVTIKFANGSTETLRSDNTATRHSSRVIVSYTDESGRRVAHLFKPAH